MRDTKCLFFWRARVYPRCHIQKNEAIHYGEQSTCALKCTQFKYTCVHTAQHNALHQIHIIQSLLHTVNNSNVTNISSNVLWRNFRWKFYSTHFFILFFLLSFMRDIYVRVYILFAFTRFHLLSFSLIEQFNPICG